MLALETHGSATAPGEAYLNDTPLLASHRGTQPDLFLRWNAVPAAASAIDVVVFLHGFSQRAGGMQIAEKVAPSGLDLSGRARPTLALLPRGNWLRHSWYDFPALLGDGLDRLVAYGLERLAAALPSPRALTCGWLILAAHSGGGMPAVDALASAHHPPDEFFVFDGLYGRDPNIDEPLRGIEAIDRWLGDRLAAEPARPGALRVVYFERQTGEFSRAVGQRIAARLASLGPALAGRLARRYKIEVSGVPHGRIAERCLPELLARSDAEFDWLA
ncbi:MAG TPA: hypothetical protein VHU15_03825 [Stellaceae bacterium]|jgi:hypothetical protein|nr:hypothetical protein [Stellaceae bacterium]